MKTKTAQNWVSKVEHLHPYQTLVYLGMVGSGLIFLFLTFAFVSSFYPQNPLLDYRFPWPFFLSTLVLLISSITANQLVQLYKQDQPKSLEKALWMIFGMGMAFTALQLWGWNELDRQGISFTGIPSGSYLFILTGIHIFHLLGVMGFLVVLIWEVHRTILDPVQDLIFTTDPFVKMKIRLFIVYWHFVDLIWLLLFLIFALAF